jgi:hypothetical protein
LQTAIGNQLFYQDPGPEVDLDNLIKEFTEVIRPDPTDAVTTFRIRTFQGQELGFQD